MGNGAATLFVALFPKVSNGVCGGEGTERLIE